MVTVTAMDTNGNVGTNTAVVTFNATSAPPAVVYVDASYGTSCSNVTFPNRVYRFLAPVEALVLGSIGISIAVSWRHRSKKIRLVSSVILFLCLVQLPDLIRRLYGCLISN